MSTKKSYKITEVIPSSGINHKDSRIVSRGPWSSIKKAANKHFSMSGIDDGEIKITIKEITKGSKHKSFTYEATRKLLKEPKIVQRGDKQVEIWHDTQVRFLSYETPEKKDTKKSKSSKKSKASKKASKKSKSSKKGSKKQSKKEDESVFTSFASMIGLA